MPIIITLRRVQKLPLFMPHFVLEEPALVSCMKWTVDIETCWLARPSCSSFHCHISWMHHQLSGGKFHSHVTLHQREARPRGRTWWQRPTGRIEGCSGWQDREEWGLNMDNISPQLVDLKTVSRETRPDIFLFSDDYELPQFWCITVRFSVWHVIANQFDDWWRPTGDQLGRVMR